METHAEGYTAQVPDREFDFFVQGFRLTVMDGRMILADLERRGRPDETWYAPPHTHSWYELFCAEKREMRYQVDGGERVLKEGECLLVAPGCVHATMPDPEGVRFTFAFFLQKEHRELAAGLLEPVLLREGTRTFPLDEESLRVAVAAARAMTARDMLSAASGVWQLLLRLSRQEEREGPEEPLSDSNISRIFRLEQLFTSYAHSDISLSALAGALHISSRHLARVIRAQYGCTYREKILLLRMEEAAHLLRTTDLPPEEVAVRVGYRTRRSFEAAFVRVWGRTPEESRSGAPAGEDIAQAHAP